MNKRRGGILSSLFGFRLVVAVLTCCILLVTGLLIRETVFPKSPVVLGASDDAYISCNAAELPKLASPVISTEHPGLTETATSLLYYDVYGQTLAQINEQLASCPVTKGGFIAETSYVLNWKASYRTVSKGTCEVSAVAVGLNTRHTYPNWNDIGGSAAGTGQAWDTFTKHLKVHEEGHIALNRQYAKRLLQTLENLAPRSCKTIAAEAEARASQIIESLKLANSGYDGATEHGRTQGAVLQ